MKFNDEHMRKPEAIVAKLYGARLFLKTDLNEGYWLILMETGPKEEKAFMTPERYYQFKRTLFGLVNSTVNSSAE